MHVRKNQFDRAQILISCQHSPLRSHPSPRGSALLHQDLSGVFGFHTNRALLGVPAGRLLVWTHWGSKMNGQEAEEAAEWAVDVDLRIGRRRKNRRSQRLAFDLHNLHGPAGHYRGPSCLGCFALLFSYVDPDTLACPDRTGQPLLERRPQYQRLPDCSAFFLHPHFAILHHRSEGLLNHCPG